MRNDEHIHAKSCICAECRTERDRDAGYDAGYDAGKAAGYAAAVADVRHLVETMMGRTRSAEMANLLMILDSGAHVGAAKKASGA